MQRDSLRYITAYTMTAFVYLFIVGCFYYYRDFDDFIISQKPKKPIMTISLSHFIPEAFSPPEIQETKEQQSPLKAVAPSELPVKKANTKIISVPVAEKTIAKIMKKTHKKSVIKKHILKKKKFQKKKRHKKMLRHQTGKTKQSHTEHIKQPKHSSKAEINRFWSHLRSKIDSHKFYPRIAKKRGMQGVVKVRFTILRDGHLGNISLQGPKLFYRSARNAIESAFPLVVQEIPVSLPKTINLTLHYQIR